MPHAAKLSHSCCRIRTAIIDLHAGPSVINESAQGMADRSPPCLHCARTDPAGLHGRIFGAGSPGDLLRARPGKPDRLHGAAGAANGQERSRLPVRRGPGARSTGASGHHGLRHRLGGIRPTPLCRHRSPRSRACRSAAALDRLPTRSRLILRFRSIEAGSRAFARQDHSRLTMNHLTRTTLASPRGFAPACGMAAPSRS